MYVWISHLFHWLLDHIFLLGSQCNRKNAKLLCLQIYLLWIFQFYFLCFCLILSPALASTPQCLFNGPGSNCSKNATVVLVYAVGCVLLKSVWKQLLSKRAMNYYQYNILLKIIWQLWAGIFLVDFFTVILMRPSCILIIILKYLCTNSKEYAFHLDFLQW